MVAKTSCLHCGNGIEFDPAQLGSEKFLVVNCPHCGKETVLTLQKAEPPRAIYTQPPPQSQKKRHGVFYYVFWGTVSLIVTVFILAVVFSVLGGMLSAALSEAKRKAAMMQATNAQATSSVETNSYSRADSTSEIAKEKNNYIQQNLVIYAFTARYQDSEFDGRVPGVSFKIRNSGSRTLNEVEVTVYFKDSKGSIISEKQFYPVLVTKYGSDNNPLKPGYIWQMEAGHFYAAKNVPSEWQEGNAMVKITDIEFLDSEKQWK